MKVDIDKLRNVDKLLIILNAFEGEKLDKELIQDIIRLYEEVKSM